MAKPYLVISRRGLALFLAACAILSMLMLLGTAAFHQFWRQWDLDWDAVPDFYKLLSWTNFATEDVPAVWFSSMLLLVASLLALLCFNADKAAVDSSRWKHGWLGLALILALLSLDELGSIHERVPIPDGMLGWLLWLGPFVLAVPLYMMMFAWFRMGHLPLALLLMAAGVLLFVSVPVQEYIEIEVKAAAGGANWRRPLEDILLEEGAELVGMMCVMAACALYAFDAGDRAANGISRIVLPERLGVWLLVYALILFASGLAVWKLPYDASGGDDAGTAQNWFPSAFALAGAVLALVAGADRSSARSAPSVRLVATASIGVSAFVGGNLHAWGAGLDPLRLGLAVLVLVAGTAALMQQTWPMMRAGYGAWALLLAVGVLFGDYRTAPLAVLAGAALLPPLLLGSFGTRKSGRASAAAAGEGPRSRSAPAGGAASR